MGKRKSRIDKGIPKKWVSGKKIPKLFRRNWIQLLKKKREEKDF